MAGHKTLGRTPQPVKDEKDNFNINTEAGVMQIAQVGGPDQPRFTVLKRRADFADNICPGQTQLAFPGLQRRMQGEEIEVGRRYLKPRPFSHLSGLRRSRLDWKQAQFRHGFRKAAFLTPFPPSGSRAAWAMWMWRWQACHSTSTLHRRPTHSMPKGGRARLVCPTRRQRRRLH